MACVASLRPRPRAAAFHRCGPGLASALAAMCLALLPPAAAGSDASPTRHPLLTTREVRALAPEDAARGWPVRIRATVTAFRAASALGYFVQDETGPIFVLPDPAAPAGDAWLEVGQEYEIEGVTAPGSYAPQIRELRRRLLGHGPLPPARALSYEQMATGAEDCQFAQIEGIVRALTPEGIVLAMGDAMVDVRCAVHDPAWLATLVDARVRLTGVVCGRFNQKRQWVGVRFSAASPDSVQVLQPAPADPFAGSSHAISELLRWDLNQHGRHRVKVAGVVTHFQPGSALFLRQGSGGLEVLTESAAELAPGDEVEVLGFPALGTYSAVLENAVFRRVGRGAAPAPHVASTDALLRGEWDACLVSVDGILLESVRQQGARVLVMQSGDVIFHARLATAAPQPAGLLPAPGSLLTLTGISEVAATDTTGARLTPRSFSLLLRSAADIHVRQGPSWWTAQRLWQALAALSALALGILSWVWLLRRQVRAQTSILKEQMQREAVLEERTRIAQELHDTLDQELTGISLQLNAAAAQVRDESLGQRLEVVHRLVRRSQSEVRRSVWDLRQPALESGGLAAALESTAAQIRGGATAVVGCRVKGNPIPLPALVEHHVLRIATEAMTNAFKHAGASRIDVELSYEPAALRLRVVDNGRGFLADQAPDHAVGHFGLIGMRERSRKIGAGFTLHSQPAAGTRIELLVPIRHTPQTSAPVGLSVASSP